jgi:hypothetical protein
MLEALVKTKFKKYKLLFNRKKIDATHNTGTGTTLKIRTKTTCKIEWKCC